MKYDLIVLGSGPAGLAAALCARGRNKSVLVIGNRWQDSPLAKAPVVDNYLGMSAQSGEQMLETFVRQVKEAGADFVEGRAVSLMQFQGIMVTVGSEIYEGKALILAPGVTRAAKYPGEAELLGRGVSYCATCDGMLYRGKEVVVIGQSTDAPHEANYLHSIGCKVTYVAAKRPEELEETIPFVKRGKISVQGETQVSGLMVNETEIPCAGVFILRNAVAPTDLLPALKTEAGAIWVDRRMATSLPGVFAAGDCTGQPLQIAKAVGEGHVAALSACEYLDNQKQE